MEKLRPREPSWVSEPGSGLAVIQGPESDAHTLLVLPRLPLKGGCEGTRFWRGICSPAMSVPAQ